MKLGDFAREHDMHPTAMLPILRNLDKKARGLLLVRGGKRKNGKPVVFVRMEVFDDLRLGLDKDAAIADLSAEVQQLRARVEELERRLTLL